MTRYRTCKRTLTSAAVLAVAVLSVAGCGNDDDASSDTTAPPATTAAPTTAGPTTTLAPTSTVVGAADLDAAEQVVTRFLDALGRGDVDTAAAQLGPISEERAAAAGGVRSLLQESTEGHGSWAGATDRTVTPIGIAPGIVAVRMEGTLTVEGTVEHRVEVFPARKAESAGAWFVEPWAYDIAADRPFEIVAPTVDEEERAAADPAGPTTVRVRAREAGTVLVSFDGAAPRSADVAAGGEASFDPPAGAVSSVVVVFSAGAALAAQGFTVETAGS